ncbi:MAG: hypothetical protein Q8J84_10545 [Flavobacteriaceae bacterium]|nr:hypothetical protein [Flavobacteriaceae bacterium]
MKSIIFRILVVSTFVLLTANVRAHKSEPPAPDRSSDAPPVGVPIDGGVSLLFIIGAVYGIYKLKKN